MSRAENQLKSFLPGSNRMAIRAVVSGVEKQFMRLLIRSIRIRTLYSIVALFLLPASVYAAPAITCHCFTDRSFDPVRPAQADPYFLATTQNTFFAAVFNVDKKTIVIKKQHGVSSDDLWVAYWVASKSSISAETLLQAKKNMEPWKNVIASLRISPKTLGDSFAGSLTVKPSAAHLANTVVDELFRSYQLLSDGELDALRKAGVSNQELILSTIISAKSREPAKQIYHEVKQGAKTWGFLLQSVKIDSKNMQAEISAVLKLHAR